MSDREGLLTRLRTRLTPQLLEDWGGKAGQRWRAGIARLRSYGSKHQFGQKLDAVLELAWRKTEGVASIEHAQAQKAYAEVEILKLEAELRRRTMDSNVIKAEAEADLANIAAFSARFDLHKKLKDAGMCVTGDSPFNLFSFGPAPATPPLELE